MDTSAGREDSFGFGQRNHSGILSGAPAAVDTTSAPSDENFTVVAARNYFFARLPKVLKSQLAYRHFYTDELDVGIQPDRCIRSSVLSAKFFGSLLMYLCSLFKLEGRRKQYEQLASEKAGREFADAHNRTQEIFQFLTASYGTILMTYNCHNELEYPLRLTPQLKLQLSKSGPQAHGMKAPLPVVKRASAFTYRSDELRFYEELFTMAEDIVSLAFHEDDEMKRNAVTEVNRLFRSDSFLFKEQKREDDIRTKALSLDRKSKGVLHNSRRVVELLQPPIPSLVIKYAIQQRTPFIGSKFPGGTSYMKYQRVKKEGSDMAEPSKMEKMYNAETGRVLFPIDHPAMAEVAAMRPKSRGSSVQRMRDEVEAGKKGGYPLRLSSPDSSSSATSGEKRPTSTAPAPKLLPDLHDFDAEGNYLKENPLEPKSMGNQRDGQGKAVELSAISEISIRQHDKALVGEKRVGLHTLPASGSGKGKPTLGDLRTEQSVMMDDPSTTNSGREKSEKAPISNKGILFGRKGSGIDLMDQSLESGSGVPIPRRQSGRVDFGFHTVSSFSNPNEDEGSHLHLHLHSLPDSEWLAYNPKPDIEAIHHSRKYGVEVPTFHLPSDLMVNYDESGRYLPPQGFAYSPSRNRSAQRSRRY
jgi:hypothetical protein